MLDLLVEAAFQTGPFTLNEFSMSVKIYTGFGFIRITGGNSQSLDKAQNQT